METKMVGKWWNGGERRVNGGTVGRRGGFKEMVERRGEIEEGVEKGEIIRYTWWKLFIECSKVLQHYNNKRKREIPPEFIIIF